MNRFSPFCILSIVETLLLDNRKHTAQSDSSSARAQTGVETHTPFRPGGDQRSLWRSLLFCVKGIYQTLICVSGTNPHCDATLAECTGCESDLVYQRKRMVSSKSAAVLKRLIKTAKLFVTIALRT